MKVLLLYAKVGNGHLKAAESVKEVLESHEGVEVVYEDGLEYSSALTNKLIEETTKQFIDKKIN